MTWTTLRLLAVFGLMVALSASGCSDSLPKPNLPAAKLGFTTQPRDTASGSTITPALQVAIQDENGDTNQGSTASVTLAIKTNPGAGGLTGSVTVEAVGGVATFGDISINKAGEGYILEATSDGLAPATSDPFDIEGKAVPRLVFSVEPTNVVSGVNMYSVVVHVLDSDGNVVPTAADTITVAILENPGSGTLSGTSTLNAINGIASFNDLSIDKAGIGYTLEVTSGNLTAATSGAFDVSAGYAAFLGFTTEPKDSNGGDTMPTVVVSILDNNGNVVPTASDSVNVRIWANPSSGILSGTTMVNASAGVASFSTLSIDKSGVGYTLQARITGLAATLSATFSINVGPAAFLTFASQPSSTAVGQTLPSVEVAVADLGGNTVTSATNTITLAVGKNPPTATLGGTKALAATGGVATFSNLNFDRVGSGFTLNATAPGLAGTTSGSFDILGTVGGTVTGLTGGTLVLQNNLTDDLNISASGSFTFGTVLPYGTPYSVTIAWQPPGHICNISSNTGTVGVNPVTSVEVTCVAGIFDLLITEISDSYYTMAGSWFEIYNGTESSIDLSTYSVRATGVDEVSWPPSVQSWNFPAVSISPGDYVVVRGASSGSSDFIAGPRNIVLTHAYDYYPFWSASGGFVELLNQGTTVDFVKFGPSTQVPVTAGNWIGAAASAMPHLETSYGKGLARSVSLADTNTAADWTYRDFTTPGGPNDVTCATDADQDGIPDCSEVPGSTFAGMDLYAMGARTGQKDIFVEIDWMAQPSASQKAWDGGSSGVDEALIPRAEALLKIKTVMVAHGYHVHFDVGDLIDNAGGLNPANYDLGGGNQLSWSDMIQFGPASGSAGANGSIANFHEYKAASFDVRRLPIFHYCVFASGELGMDAWGRAELYGNDFYVSMGQTWLGAPPYAPSGSKSQVLVNQQATSIMHELGHNLGLGHGGFDDVNFKPNYLSIMNYMMGTGLPTVGSNDGDRYYFKWGCPGYSHHSSLTNPADSSTFVLDFSDGTSLPLDETSIMESEGIRRNGSSPIDFDCDGNSAETLVSYDLNRDASITVLEDYDDWANIAPFFWRDSQSQELKHGAVVPHGIPAHLKSLYQQIGYDDVKVIRSPLHQDRQPIYPESQVIPRFQP